MRLFRCKRMHELFISEARGLSGPIYILLYLCLAVSARSEVVPGAAATTSARWCAEGRTTMPTAP